MIVFISFWADGVALYNNIASYHKSNNGYAIRL